MGPYQRPGQNPRVQALLWNIRIDAATAEVVDALRIRGIGSAVLKGPAYSDWYPSDSGRTYSDGDLWVAPGNVTGAEAVLNELGFAPTKDERGLPDWWLEHASNWERDHDDVRIDLHRRLQGVELNPAEVWQLLWPQTEEFRLAGKPARRLPAPARALYAALHATHHGAASQLGLAHLKAALETADDDIWRGAHELAARLNALDAFATGLALVPEGEALARRIHVPAAASVKSTLQATTPPPVALGLEELKRARGWRRGQILARKLVPPPGFIRHWWPPAARSRRMLAIGYLYRPIWLLRRTPAGYRAWRAAARAARSSS